MEALFLYFGKVVLGSGVMFLYYRLFLKDKTFHHYNRFYLLASVMISLLLPLLKVSYFTIEVNSDIYLLFNRLNGFNSSKNLSHDFVYLSFSAVVAGLVSVFFLSRLLFGLFKIQRLKKKFLKENFEGISFYQTNLNEAPFSFFRNLFWKDSIALQSDLGRQILKHEMVHIEQKHSWDKIFIETATSLFWFNPFFYHIQKEINLIHEYLADKKAVKNSDTKAFAQMLLASHFSGKHLPATSPFLSSNLKKRVTMLKKSKTKFSYARKILALPLFFLLAFIYLVNAKNKEIKNTNLEIAQVISEMKQDTIKNDTNNIEQAKMDSKAALEDSEQAILDAKHAAADAINAEQDSKTAHADAENARKVAKRAGRAAKAALKDFNSAEVQNNLKEAQVKMAEVQKKFDSPEFQQEMKQAMLKMQEVQKKFDSPEFQKEISEATAKMQEVQKKFDSPEFKKRMKEAEKAAKEVEARIKSPRFQEQFKNIERRIAGTDKSIAPPQPRLRVLHLGDLSGEITPTLSHNNLQLSMDGTADIFINGKPATREEMQKIDPKTIQSVNVNKSGAAGSEKSEIRITLK